jgi:two-component system sensor histidine kinase YesM
MKWLEVFRGKSINRRLKKQLLASFMLITILVFITSYIVVYYGILSTLEKQSEQSTFQQFKQAEYNINNLMNETGKMSKLLIVDPDIQDLIVPNQSSEVEKIDLRNKIFKKFIGVITNYDYIQSISLYGENGHILSASLNSNKYLEDPDNKSWFYKTEMYQSVKEGQPNLLWFGGYRQKDFDFLDLDSLDENPRLITAVRTLRCLGQIQQCATLIINIDERAFTSTYNSNAENTDKTIYIKDEKEQIISHNDSAYIGKKSDINISWSFSERFGSFTLKTANGKKQVIYLNLASAPWTVVSEVPYEVFANSIINLRKILLIIVVAGIVSIFLLTYYWIFRLTRPLDTLLSAMNELGKGKLGVKMESQPGNEFEILQVQFNRMSRNIYELVEKIKVIEGEKRSLEIETLQAQINPHFVYNTLNSIKWMAIMAGEQNIADSLTTLGNLLQHAFKSKSIICTLKEELAYSSLYVEIMNFRYSEGIILQSLIPYEVEWVSVPRFIFQPLVENAIIHGISSGNGRIDIRIAAEQQEEKLVIRIIDNGKGILAEKLEEIRRHLADGGSDEHGGLKSIGLVNVHRKLQLQYGDPFGLVIMSKLGFGTEITITIPLNNN